jgi:hypothetical protein
MPREGRDAEVVELKVRLGSRMQGASVPKLRLSGSWADPNGRDYDK